MKKQLSMIMVLLMTTFIGFGIIIPVLPAVVSPFHLGMMLAVYSAASFMMSPVWGALSDRFGRRPVIIAGIFGFGVSFFLFAIAGGNLGLMYVSRVLGGLFSGAVTSCAVAYVADITTEENRTKGMGLVGMSIGLGFIFGPGIGGLLSRFGYDVPFFAASGLAFVMMLTAFLYLGESLPQEKRTRRREAKPSRWTAFTGPLKYLYILGFFVSFTLAELETTLQYFQMARFNATPADIGFMLTVSGIVGAAIQGGVVRKYVKKGGEHKVILYGLVLSAAGFFLLLLSENLLTATVYLTVFAAGNALIRPCVTSLISQKTTVGQGTAAGLSSSMDSLGRITGPLLGSGMLQLQIYLPFIIGGLLSLAAIGLLYRYIASDRETSLSY